jgi:hypothetical protein
MGAVSWFIVLGLAGAAVGGVCGVAVRYWKGR